MRSFSSGPPTKAESPFVFNLKRYFWMFAPISLIIFIAGVGIILALLANRPTEAPGGEISPSSQKSTRTTLSLLNESNLMDAYFEASALGGRAAVESISTVRSSGMLRWGDQAIDCTLTKRRPNLVLLELKDTDSKITYEYDGKTIWQMSELPGASAAEHEGTKQTEEAVRNMARFFDPLLTYILQGGGTIQVIEVDEYDGASVLRVQLRDPSSNRMDIYLDTDHLEILATIEHLSPSGKKRTSLFQDYRRINGVRVPFQIKVSTDSELLYELQLNTWRSKSEVSSEQSDKTGCGADRTKQRSDIENQALRATTLSRIS